MKKLLVIALVLFGALSVYALDNITKPYTFTPNTRANSSEVNSNFDTVYGGANNAISAINTASGSKTTLDARLDNGLNEDGTLKPYVYVSTFANLSTAKVSIGSASKTLYVDAATTANNLTLENNVHLKIAPEGSINVASGKTLTVKGSYSIPSKARVFTGTGTVSGLSEARPEWWGTNTTPGTTDMTAAIQAALDTGSPVVLSATNYAVTKLTRIAGSVSGLYFRGAGSDFTTITLTGGASDVYSYTYPETGTTTVTGAILFSAGGNGVGGLNLGNIGGFTIIGNANIDYGLTLCNMFRGSRLSDVRMNDFAKAGYAAVPLTLYRNIELVVSDFVTNRTGRLIRLVGCNDRVIFERNTHYNFGVAYPGIFIEEGYNGTGVDELHRYPVQVIFDKSYFHGGDTSPYRTVDGMDAATRVAIEATNSKMLTLKDIWFENVGYALKTTYIAPIGGATAIPNDRIVITGSIRGGSVIPSIDLVNSSYDMIDWDWPITMDSDSKYNLVRHGQIDSTLIDETTYETSDTVALDRVHFNGYYNSAARSFEMSKTIFTCGVGSPGTQRDVLSLGSGSNLWTASHVTGEYYYNGSAITSVRAPYKVYANGTALTSGTLGSLTDDHYAWGDNDSIGRSTVYIKLAVGDPDAQASGYMKSVDSYKGRVYTRLDGSGYIYIYNIATDDWVCLNTLGAP